MSVLGFNGVVAHLEAPRLLLTGGFEPVMFPLPVLGAVLADVLLAGSLGLVRQLAPNDG